MSDKKLNRKRSSVKDTGTRSFVLEPLEPRLLLSADPMALAVGSDVSLLSHGKDLYDSVDYDSDVFDTFVAAYTTACTTDDLSGEINNTPLPEPLDLSNISEQSYSDTESISNNDNSVPELASPPSTLPDGSYQQALDAVAFAYSGTDARHELVFIDTHTPEYETLLNTIQQSNTGIQYEIILLDPDNDGIAQISDVLTGYDDLDAIHFISHGSDGAVQLGSTWLQLENLNDYAQLISGWQQSLDTDADLLFYGCNLASTDEGVSLISNLGQLTGADVAASDDLTGTSALGGDWELEVQIGDVDTNIALTTQFQQNWNNVLVDPTGSGSLTTTSLNDNAGATSLFGGISVIDPDPGETDLAVRITLSDPTAGIISSGGFIDLGAGVYELTGLTPAQADSALDLVTFTPASNTGSSGTFTTDIGVYADDQGGAGFQTVLAPTTVTITRVNDAPIATNLSSASNYIVGDPTVAITDIVVSDVDSGETISATLTLANTSTGSLSINDGASYFAATGTWSITGTVANVNTALANVTFNPFPANNINTSISVSIDDGDEDASGPLSGTINLNVTPFNNTPTTSGITNVTVNEDAANNTVDLHAAFADVEDADNMLTYTVQSNDNPGLFAATSFDPATGLLTLDFAADQNGTATLTIRATDTGGNFIDTNFSVTVDPINDAPTAITISNSTVDEMTDTGSGYIIGTLAAVDVDTGDSATYSIGGGADGDKFTISGSGELILSDNRLDFETQSSYEVVVTVTDSGGLSYDQVLIISVNDLTEIYYEEDILPEPTPALPDAPVISSPTTDNAMDNVSGSPTYIDISDETQNESEVVTGSTDSQDAQIFYDDTTFDSNETKKIDTDNRSNHVKQSIEVSIQAILKSIEIQLPGWDDLMTQGQALSDPMTLLDQSAFSRDLDQLHNKADDELLAQKIKIGAGIVLSTGASIGYVAYLVRGSVLLSSMLASLPIWAMIDPTPVLASMKRTAKKDDDDDSLESLLNDKDATSEVKKNYNTDEQQS